MYDSTTYIPVINNKICDEIITQYGVAQGCHSSPDCYSSYVSDMPECTTEMNDDDFMDPGNRAQLADDTILLVENLQIFIQKFICLLKYSKKMYRSLNILKTVYCHFSQNPSIAPIQIDSNIWISGVNISHAHKYLGMKFIPTNNFEEIIKFNLNNRKGKICKFYAWLENNYDTPIETKLLVLDN